MFVDFLSFFKYAFCEVECCAVGEVEDELLPTEHWFVPRCSQRPVRVGAEEGAVGVDHLRLDPDPELHAEPRHVTDQWLEAVRVDVVRDPPVAEAAGVVATRSEPAVVEHEPLDPDVGRRIGLVAPIVNGRGRAKLGDSSWTVTGPELPAGEIVEVVGVDGVVLEVRSVTGPTPVEAE